MARKSPRVQDDIAVHRAWNEWARLQKRAMRRSPDNLRHPLWERENLAAWSLREKQDAYAKRWNEIWMFKAEGEGFESVVRQWHAKHGRII